MGILLVPESVREVTGRTIGLVASRSAQTARVVPVPTTKAGASTRLIGDTGLTVRGVPHRARRMLIADRAALSEPLAPSVSSSRDLVEPMTHLRHPTIVRERSDE